VTDCDSEKVRHFTDAVNLARNEALAEEKSSAKYLTEENLCRLVVVLFNAGISGSVAALQWTLMMLAKYPEHQERLRAEVKEVIGDRTASINDREKLPLLSSYVMEILRFFPLAGLVAFHETTCDTELNGLKIPHGTHVMI